MLLMLQHALPRQAHEPDAACLRVTSRAVLVQFHCLGVVNGMVMSGGFALGENCPGDSPGCFHGNFRDALNEDIALSVLGLSIFHKVQAELKSEPTQRLLT